MKYDADNNFRSSLVTRRGHSYRASSVPIDVEVAFRTRATLIRQFFVGHKRFLEHIISINEYQNDFEEARGDGTMNKTKLHLHEISHYTEYTVGQT